MTAIRMPIEAARRGQRLAEKQRDYLLELQRTGRWHLHYSAGAFQAQINEAIESAKIWAQLVEQCAETVD